MVLLMFVIGFGLGWFAMQLYLSRKVIRMLREAKNVEAVRKIVHIDFVKLKDQIYVYNRETQAFLVQGTSREEISTFLTKTYPDTNFMANTQNLKDVGL